MLCEPVASRRVVRASREPACCASQSQAGVLCEPGFMLYAATIFLETPGLVRVSAVAAINILKSIRLDLLRHDIEL